MYAIIRNAIHLGGNQFGGGTYTGAIESKHRSIEAAEKARDRLNARCRKANPGSWLDLTIGEIVEVKANGTHATVCSVVR